MRILSRGNAHKREVGIVECTYCASEFRVILGDPMATYRRHGSDGRNFIKCICPVCKEQVTAYDTIYAGSKGVSTVTFKEVTLDKEDREEIASWKETDVYELSDSDCEFLECIGRSEYKYTCPSWEEEQDSWI